MIPFKGFDGRIPFPPVPFEPGPSAHGGDPQGHEGPPPSSPDPSPLVSRRPARGGIPAKLQAEHSAYKPTSGGAERALGVDPESRRFLRCVDGVRDGRIGLLRFLLADG